MAELEGMTVLVTGASQGVGRGIALAAGAAGALVLVTARKFEAADAVAAEIRARGGTAVGLACDVTDLATVAAAVAAAVSHFGRLDAIVHNATSRYSPRPSKVEEIADEEWEDQVAVGLRGAFFCAQAALPELRRTGGSFIVLVSSAGVDGAVTLPIYSAVKGGQRALVKSLAREWGPEGVRVNAVAPVAMTPAMQEYFDRQPQMRAQVENRAPLRRIGDPETDIGRALAFLIGRDSGFVTGQTMFVDGGAMMP